MEWNECDMLPYQTLEIYAARHFVSGDPPDMRPNTMPQCTHLKGRVLMEFSQWPHTILLLTFVQLTGYYQRTNLPLHDCKACPHRVLFLCRLFIGQWLPLCWLFSVNKVYILVYLYTFYIIVSSVRSTYGGYYGFVVVTPRPQTLHRSHDNLKKSLSDCFHILYVDWYRWEDAWEARWARSTQGPPNSQKCTFLYIVAHKWQTGSYFFPLLYICLLCDEVLRPWNFRSPGFDIRAPRTPQIWKRSIFVSYFGFKLNNLLSDCFLIWHVHRFGWG